MRRSLWLCSAVMVCLASRAFAQNNEPAAYLAPLPTGSANLSRCSADGSGTFTNTVPTDHVFDMTGNLRELTRVGANQYTLMGGSYQWGCEAGATCSFTQYNVDQSFKLADTGFRCCFSQDPTQ